MSECSVTVREHLEHVLKVQEAGRSQVECLFRDHQWLARVAAARAILKVWEVSLAGRTGLCPRCGLPPAAGMWEKMAGGAWNSPGFMSCFSQNVNVLREPTLAACETLKKVQECCRSAGSVASGCAELSREVSRARLGSSPAAPSAPGQATLGGCTSQVPGWSEPQHPFLGMPFP